MTKTQVDQRLYKKNWAWFWSHWQFTLARHENLKWKNLNVLWCYRVLLPLLLKQLIVEVQGSLNTIFIFLHIWMSVFKFDFHPLTVRQQQGSVLCCFPVTREWLHLLKRSVCRVSQIRFLKIIRFLNATEDQFWTIVFLILSQLFK